MMNPRVKLALTLICLAPFLTLGAKAMTVEQFGRLDDDDEAGFVAFLVEASAQLLKSQGQPEQAHQVIALFKEAAPNGGVARLAENVKEVNALNKRHALNPNNRIPDSQIEDALARTLKEAGFNVPAKYLLAAGKGFHPDDPPRSRPLGI